MTESPCLKKWRISLGMRNNLLYNDIPYIPILVEDISLYTSYDDFEENSVKTIQTMGELIPQSEMNAKLVSITPGINSEFPISLKNLLEKDIYTKNKNGTHCAIWEKHKVFKVYGILKVKKEKAILYTTHLVPVHDISGSWNIFTLLLSMARNECRMYHRTKKQNEVLELQWQTMKEQKTRLVSEDTT